MEAAPLGPKRRRIVYTLFIWCFYNLGEFVLVAVNNRVPGSIPNPELCHSMSNTSYLGRIVKGSSRAIDALKK